MCLSNTAPLLKPLILPSFFPGWLGWDRVSLCADRVTNASSYHGHYDKNSTDPFQAAFGEQLGLLSWALTAVATLPAVWLYADNRGEVFCRLGGWSHYCIYNRSNMQKAKIHNVSLILWNWTFYRCLIQIQDKSTQPDSRLVLNSP